MTKAYINAQILDPYSKTDEMGGLLVEDGIIKALGSNVTEGNIASDVEKIDIHGKAILPALVDFRCEIPDPGFEAKGSLSSESKAALAGGVVHLALLPTTSPAIDNPAMVTYMIERSQAQKGVKVYPWGAVTKESKGEDLAELGLMQKEGAIGFTDGHKTLQNAAVLRRALQYASGFDGFIAQHPMDVNLGKGDMNAGSLANRLGLAGMSWQAEVIIIERDLRILEMAGGSLHFNHISCKASVDVIRKAKAKGVNVTCDTAPPYFSLNELDVGDYRTFAKLNPPLRTEEDRLAIIEGLKDGTIDFIASDHIPQDEEAKRLPFDQASFGGVGLESLLPITLELYHNKHLNLNDALALITYKPAKRLGINAGYLAADMAADFIVVDLQKGRVFDDKQLHSRSRNSPFGGRLVQGEILHSFVDGQCLFSM
ncbi:MAG: dihydroorotase [Alphaproteobacteria bacterium]